MTVQLATTDRDGLHHYVGESSDTKPTATTVPPKSSFWETDTDDIYWNNGTAWVKHQHDLKRMAGERNTDSSTNDYQVVRNESNSVYINTTSAVTLGGGAAGDAHLKGIRIWANFTGDLTIQGFADQAGAAQTRTLTTPTAGYYEFPDAINSAGALILTAANGADAMKCQVFWRPV